jgi:hypothetical protein
MMRKFLITTAMAAGAMLMASQASATEFAGHWTLTELGSSDPGLVVQTTKSTGAFHIADGVLSSTQTAHRNLFNLYTNEGSIEGDDINNPLDIQLTFTFDDPTLTSGGVLDGTTVGESNPFLFFQGVFQNGVLTWANGGETDVHFGAGLTGLLKINVNGGEFNNGLFGLDEGRYDGLKVGATFDWINDPTGGGVPEPASWALMIGGFGMTGAMLRRRKLAAVAA